MIVVLLEDLDTVHSGSGSNLDRSDNFFVLFFVCFMVDYELGQSDKIGTMRDAVTF